MCYVVIYWLMRLCQVYQRTLYKESSIYCLHTFIYKLPNSLVVLQLAPLIAYAPWWPHINQVIGYVIAWFFWMSCDLSYIIVVFYLCDQRIQQPWYPWSWTLNTQYIHNSNNENLQVSLLYRPTKFQRATQKFWLYGRKTRMLCSKYRINQNHKNTLQEIAHLLYL